MAKNIKNICKTVSINIFLLSKLNETIRKKAKPAFFSAHIMSHIWDSCAKVHMKQLGSLHKRAVTLLMLNPTIAYMNKYSGLKLLRLDKHLLFSICAKACSRQSSTIPEISCFLKDVLTRFMDINSTQDND